MYLGIDLGTSGLRALLIDDAQKTVASAERAYPVSHPQPGWSEQNPSDWIAACEGAVADVKSSAPEAFSALRGIAVSGQMHGATLIGKNDEILRPCILWNDTRSEAEATAFDAAPNVRDLSANIVFPGFTAPKLAWVRSHEPEIFAKIQKVLLPKDYLGFWLTGEFVSDMSDSAGTSWLDVGGRRWSAALLEAGGMRADQMPDLVEGSEAAGTLRPDLAAQWGVSAGVTVAGGAGDNAAAACGVGALLEGDGFVSLGTSGVLLAARNSFAPSPESAVHTFCHAVPGRWYQMGVILSATDSLNWLSQRLQASPQDLSEALGNSIGKPGRIRFLPYLSGERTPHNDSRIRGALVGIDIASTNEDLTRSVMEGVAFALRDSLGALKGTGASLDRVLGIGGGAQSRYWIELMATVLGMPIDLPDGQELGAALGAARLAICAANGATPEEIMHRPPVAQTIAPRAELTEAYEAAYASYRALYPALKDLQ
jgi:xylulokinase